MSVETEELNVYGVYPGDGVMFDYHKPEGVTTRIGTVHLVNQGGCMVLNNPDHQPGNGQSTHKAYRFDRIKNFIIL